MRRPLRFAARVIVPVTLLAPFALVSCGGGDDEEEGATEVTVGDDDSDVTTGDDTDATQPDDTAPDEDEDGGDEPSDVDVDVSGDGGCSVTVEGDVSASWSNPATDSLLYGPWIEGNADYEGFDDDVFLFSCNDPDPNGGGGLSVTSKQDFDVPMEAATYQLTPADNAMNGQGADDPIQIVVTLEGTDTNWGLADPGTFTITEFTEDRVAGNFTIRIKDVLADLAGQESKGSATLTGQFAFTDDF